MGKSFTLKAALLSAAFILIYGLISLFHLPLQTDLFSLFPPHLTSLQNLKKLQKKTLSSQELFVVLPEQGDWTESQITDFKALFRNKILLTSALREVEGLSLNPSDLARPIAVAISSLPPEEFQRFAAQFQKAALLKKIQETSHPWQGVIDEESLFLQNFDPLGLLSDSPLLPMIQKMRTSSSSRWLRLHTPLPVDSFDSSQALEKSLRALIQSTLFELQLSEKNHPVWLTGEAMFNSQISASMKRDITIMLSFTILLVIALFLFIYRSLMPLLWIFFVQLLVILSAVIIARLFLGGLNVITIGFASILIGVSLDYCILVYHYYSGGGTGEDQSWRVLRKGIWFSAISTGGAFGVLYFSSFPGLQQMAVLVATGLLASAGFSTTLLAIALQRWRPKSTTHLNPYPQRWGAFLQIHSRKILLGFGLLLVTLSYFFILPNFNQLYDDDVSRLQPNALEAYQAHAQLKTWGAKFTSPHEPLDSNRALWPRESKSLVEANWTPPSKNLGYALTLELLSILDDWSENKLPLASGSPGDREWKSLRQELDQTAVRDFKKLSILMLLLMGALTVLAHRSVKHSILNLSALAFGLLFFIGLLALLQIPLTLVSLICVPLLIGLIIDYTMHFLLEFEHESGDLRKTFHHLLIPIGTTGLTSLIGFTAPALSSQPALLNFGWVMDLGVLSAMVSVLLFLPCLALFFQKKNQKHYSKSLYSAKIFTLANQLATSLPRPFLRRIARIGAAIYLYFHSERRRMIESNLHLLGACPGEQPSAWRLYMNFASVLVDYFYFGNRSPQEQMTVTRNKIGYEHLAEVHAQGRGGFILTSHLSFFELGGMLLTGSGYKGKALSMPEPTSELTTWRTEFRARWGIETIEVGSDPFSTFQILETLRRNEFVLALIDRPNAAQTTEVEFPNGKIEMASGILLIALATGSPILIGAVTESLGGYYDSVIYPPLKLQTIKNRQAMLEQGCNQIRDILLPVLQKNPNQWFQFTDLKKK